MGCDIHLFVEKRVDGKWQSADRWVPDEDAEESGRFRVQYEDRFYKDRCYSLFAILADVRNYGRFNPIDSPRGIPDDACDRVRAESDSWDSDGHSHSWFTLAELLAFDWTQTVALQGVVNGPTYEDWTRWDRKNGECPREYSQSVGGGSIRNVELVELETLVGQAKSKHQGWHEQMEEIGKTTSNIFATVTWEQPYFKTCRRFWSDLIPRLLRLGAPEDVRIVFFFDN